MAQGEFALINQHLSIAMQKPPIGWNPVGNHEILVLMADAAGAQRDLDALGGAAAQAEGISRQLGHQLYHAVSLRALGIQEWMKGNDALGKAHLLEALEIFQKLETPWQAGRTLYDLAEMLAGQGRNNEAGEYYTRAIVEFERMQAKPLLDRARAAFEETAHFGRSIDRSRS